MARILLTILSLCILQGAYAATHATPDLADVKDMLDRIGGPGASRLIDVRLDTTMATSTEEEVFAIGPSIDSRPQVSGSSLSALTAGIGWYLNHYAAINISWSNPHVDLTDIPLPVPETTERHSTTATHRYYLNYCTFSYSTSTWTWERWQQEIDWMALHGINMPLQIVGLEEVWRRMLSDDFGYSLSEACDFVAGPAFMAWFGMNNLEGWGGPNPDWWFTRQAGLGQKIIRRMKSLGMGPVLPGFSGMVPSGFSEKTSIPSINQGSWCGFQRPRILDPTSEAFATVAASYYKALNQVLGPSRFYSFDPFHEGANTSGIPMGEAYRALFDAMNRANPESAWVVQQWQWTPQQYAILDAVPLGRLIVLDLNAERVPNLGAYRGHTTIYSTIFNFGGRTGFDGHFDHLIGHYLQARERHPNLRGIGAAPEAIGQTPVMFDILFELPWMESQPDPGKWIEDYATRRYGAVSDDATRAWQLLRHSALNCSDNIQGPHEATICARPGLNVDRVSTWGGNTISYNPDSLAKAARLLLSADLEGPNYEFDLVDITRQALTDRSKAVLDSIRTAHEKADTAAFIRWRDLFLNIILDLDELLASNSQFMAGTWLKGANDIATEAPRPNAADSLWLEMGNARTLITTWGPRKASEDGGLHDYSYRQWSGLLRDFYYPRWKRWFDEGMPSDTDWFEMDYNWAHNLNVSYSPTPEGNPKTIARRLLDRYLSH